MNASPAKWCSVTLGQVISPQGEREIPKSTSELPFIGMEHVEAHSGTVVGRGRAADIASLSPKVHAGDVLYGRLRPYLNKVAIAPDDAFVSGEFIVFRRNGNVDARWLKWRLTAQDFVRFATSLNSGDRPRVKWPQMADFKLDLPSVDEQRQIVDILEDHLSRLDAGQRELETALIRTANFRTSMYRSVFSRYAGAERPLTEVARIENGQTPKGLVDALVSEAGPDSVPFYKVGDMNGGDGRAMPAPRFYVDRTVASHLRLHLRPPGVVLIPKRGGAIATNKKRVLEKEAAYDLNTMGLRPSSDLSVEYLWRFLQGIDLGRIADGTAVPQINAKQIGEVQIPVVHPTEQHKIIAELAGMLEASERLDREVSRAATRARALRRALLAAAFSGKLTGSDSDIERVEEIAGV